MRIFLIFLTIMLLTSCTIEVAKEVTKATKSIKTTVENIHKTQKNEDITKDSPKKEKTAEVNLSLEEEKEILEVDKKQQKKLVKIQKKITNINFLGRTAIQLRKNLGIESFSRLDGNTKIFRYDQNTCRLFFFFNSKSEKSGVKHFEIRDLNGNLINSKKEINSCYKEFKLI